MMKQTKYLVKFNGIDGANEATLLEADNPHYIMEFIRDYYSLAYRDGNYEIYNID